jgi:hypothetical protein
MGRMAVQSRENFIFYSSKIDDDAGGRRAWSKGFHVIGINFLKSSLRG